MDCTDDLYCELYERITFDLGARVGVGSREHFQSTFAALVEGVDFDRVEEHLALSRLPNFSRLPGEQRSGLQALLSRLSRSLSSGGRGAPRPEPETTYKYNSITSVGVFASAVAPPTKPGNSPAS